MTPATIHAPYIVRNGTIYERRPEGVWSPLTKTQARFLLVDLRERGINARGAERDRFSTLFASLHDVLTQMRAEERRAA